MRFLLLLLSIVIISACGRSLRRTPEKRVDANLPEGIIVDKEATNQYYIIVVERDGGIREPAIVSRIMYGDCIIGDTLAHP